MIVPSLHKAYIAAMIRMFGDCTLHATKVRTTSSRSPDWCHLGSRFEASHKAYIVVMIRIFGGRTLHATTVTVRQCRLSSAGVEAS